MSEWQECELSEIAEVQTGPFGSQLKNEQYITGGTPVVTVEHITNFRIDDFDYPSVTNEDKERLSRYLLNEGDIIFTRVGSVDLSAYVKAHQHDWMFSSRMLRVRPHKKVDSRFLSYFFQQKSFRDYILNISVGATMPSINTGILKSVLISYPPLPEQKAIAAVLSSLDDKIDLLHRQNKTLEAMAETLFRQWFVVEAKEDWLEKPLGYLFEISSGKCLKKENLIDNGIYPVLGANGEIGRTNDYLFDEKLLFTGRVGTLGNIFIIDNAKVWLSDNTLVFTKIKYFYFVYFLLKTARLGDYNAGSTQPLIRQSDIKEIPIIFPNDEKLNIFEIQSGLLFDKVKTNQKQIRILKTLRDNLLPKLMSGEVRVTY
ncbi:MAG: restriction endonuclease subunit S [Methylobacter sp.]|nr:restriction endonuclease subunit S [Methylobacter sp.]